MTDEQVTRLAGDRIAHAMYTWEPYMHNPKLRYRLHRINVPTLMLWGASDGMVSVAYAEAYRRMIPGATLVVIPEAGHLPHIEQPNEIVDTRWPDLAVDHLKWHRLNAQNPQAVQILRQDRQWNRKRLPKRPLDRRCHPISSHHQAAP